MSVGARAVEQGDGFGFNSDQHSHSSNSNFKMVRETTVSHTRDIRPSNMDDAITVIIENNNNTVRVPARCSSSMYKDVFLESCF